MTTRPPGYPMTADPFVASADPIPIASDPYVARRRRDADDLDSRRRRRHHHDTACIVALIGNDHTPGQDAGKEAAGQDCDYPFVLIHDRYHIALKDDKDANAFRPTPLTGFMQRAYRPRLRSSTRARLGFVIAAAGQLRLRRGRGARCGANDPRLQSIHGFVGPVQ